MLIFYKKVDFYRKGNICQFENVKLFAHFKCLKDSSFGSDNLHIWGDIKHESKLCEAMHTCNPSTWELRKVDHTSEANRNDSNIET